MARTLSTQEKRVLIGGGAVALVLIVALLVIVPLRQGFAQLDRQISQKKTALTEAGKLQQELQSLQQRLAETERRFQQVRSFSLLQYMEGLGNSLISADQLVYLRPKADQQDGALTISTLEARYQNLDLGQAVSLINQISNAPAVVRVTSLSLKKRFDRPKFLDLDLTVSAYVQRN